MRLLATCEGVTCYPCGVSGYTDNKEVEGVALCAKPGITTAAVAEVVIDTTADASNVTTLMANTDVTSIELGKAAKPTLSALEESIPILAKE